MREMEVAENRANTKSEELENSIKEMHKKYKVKATITTDIN